MKHVPDASGHTHGTNSDMSTENTRVVIIGGGLAGLASAVELRTRGLDVTVVDRNEHLGGKMNVLQESGFTFDMGPTILTMPQVIRGIISRTGRTVSDYLDIVDLVQWRCFYEDGTVIDLEATSTPWRPPWIVSFRAGGRRGMEIVHRLQPADVRTEREGFSTRIWAASST